MTRVIATLLGAVSMMASGLALACEPDAMMTTENGFILKVVGLSDKIAAYPEPKDDESKFALELLQPYFAMCEDGEYYRVTDVRADTVEQAMTGQTGYVLKTQVALWPTREALVFSDVAFMADRPEIKAWGDEETLKKFMETGDFKLYSPAFREDIESTLKRERATRPYPVLDSSVYKFRRLKDKRVFKVLLPAALDGTIRLDVDDVESTKKAFKNATIVIVFDATGSMATVAAEVANRINTAIRTLGEDVRENARIGFLFYRDIDDDERLVEFPPMPYAEASEALKDMAIDGLMSGGGDVPEPILDATFYAATQYDWSQSGRRILVGVLNSDAKPLTIGGLDDESRVPAGLDANQVANMLREKSIDMITVQAGPDAGPNLESVLQTLGAGKEFIRWDSKEKERALAARLLQAMSAEATKEVERGKTLSSKITEYAGYATIPLEVLDGELMERLRRSGIDFNINPGEAGVLINEGYIIEFQDLLSPEIQIEKETLENLINLYAVLGTGGVDSEGFRISVAEAIATIAGEDYDPSEDIASIIEKKLGIKFQSELLSFDLEYLEAMSTGERLKFTKRIGEAGDKLAYYLESRLEEFGEQPAVYMPVAALP